MIGLNKQFNHKKLSRYCSLNGVTQSWTFFELLPRCHVLCTRPYALQSHFALPPLPQLPCETSFIKVPICTAQKQISANGGLVLRFENEANIKSLIHIVLSWCNSIINHRR